jgi:hypothetical protein
MLPTAVVTSTLNVCGEWTTTDTGGVGLTPAALQRLLSSKGFPVKTP